jgi:hypothetical protein
MQNRKPEKLNSSTNCQTVTGSDQFTVADLTYHAAHNNARVPEQFPGELRARRKRLLKRLDLDARLRKALCKREKDGRGERI